MTYDVEFIKSVGDDYRHALVHGHDNGKVVSGTKKLIQRVVLELMSFENEPFGLVNGSGFVKRIFDNPIHNENDVFVSFAVAVSEITQKIRQQQKPTDPPEEILRKIAINGLQIFPDRLEISITIATEAAVHKTKIPLEFSKS